MKTSKSRIALGLICGLFTGTAVSSEVVALAAQDKRLESSAASANHVTLLNSYQVPISQKSLVKSAGVSPEDAAITMQVLDILGRHGALDVAVATREGIVTLVGFVPGVQHLDHIVNSVQKISGVKGIKIAALSVG